VGDTTYTNVHLTCLVSAVNLFSNGANLSNVVCNINITATLQQSGYAYISGTATGVHPSSLVNVIIFESDEMDGVY